jgi:hypothetical protein
LIAVENDLLRRVLHPARKPSPLAAVNGVLLALLGARQIPPTAIAKGDRDVGLLHVREHLLVKAVTQAVERLHDRLGVGVFGLQVGGHLGVVLVAKPGVVVGQNCAVQSGLFVVLAGDGRLKLRIIFISL